MSQGFADFANKNIVILGLARQGLALSRFFTATNATVTISDVATQEKLVDELAALANLPIKLALGGHPLSLLDGCDLLCLSGGVPPQIEIVQQAIQRGIPLTNDSLLTLQLAAARGLGPTIAITGSSGKTTTTTLVGEILSTSITSDKRKVHLGGNIGLPLIDRLDDIYPGEPLVLELSSFQLELFDPTISWGNFEQMGPDVAAILNVTPNHLDRHPSMAAYVDAKLNLLRFLRPNSTIVLSADDPVTNSLGGFNHLGAKDSETDKSDTNQDIPAEWNPDQSLREARQSIPLLEQASWFSRERNLAGISGDKAIDHTSLKHTEDQGAVENRFSRGAWLDGDTLIYAGEPICERHELLLCGLHNVSNFLAAATICGAIGDAISSGTTRSDITSNDATIDVTSESMKLVAQRFPGVPHRLETVAEKDGVIWINDNIATSPERALAGLRSFDRCNQTIILLVGGKDKNLAWESLADEAVARVEYVIGFGAIGSMFVDLVQQRAQFAQLIAPNTAVVQRLEEAVNLAALTAYSKSKAMDASTQMDNQNNRLTKTMQKRVADLNPIRSCIEAQPNTKTKETVVLLSPGGTSYDAYKDFEQRGNHFRQLVIERSVGNH
ncbi:hypothetical protein KFU94_17910 [Chloroflexi bacterium TSY]|nr:hypothetical protein [Chloroflexi bacterium TSY]